MTPFLQSRRSANTIKDPSEPKPQDNSALHNALAMVAKTSAGAAPNVQLIKEGDKVVRLVVSCSCGERVEIECIYPV
jgi:hypothetical protein